MPDIPSFAVDDGFTYIVPEEFEVSIGSRVRVRVSGRSLKGFVTAVDVEVGDRKLLPLEGVIGSIPSFDASDLSVLRWCATHYVAPLSVILRRTIPPNIPKPIPDEGVVGDPDMSKRATRHEGRSATPRPTQIMARPPYGSVVLDTVGDVVRSGATALVVAPTVDEVERIADVLREELADRLVVAHSDQTGRVATGAWVRAATEPGVCVVGTREICLWPSAGLGIVVVVEDARRVMRSPSTPTLGSREVLLARARAGNTPITFVSPLPSLEVMALRPTLVTDEGRPWSLVEIADRSEEPPTSSPVLDRARAAVAHVARTGLPAFVLVPRRAHSAMVVCATCGAMRRCQGCGAIAASTEPCGRCGTSNVACVACGGDRFRSVGAGRGNVIEDLHRVVGDQVGDASAERLVTVGTERDLIGRTGMALAVAIDIDTIALAPNYRASEDALRLLVRLSHTLDQGRGRRCLVQTADPDQPVISAFRTGAGMSFLERELAVRKRSMFPPYGQLIALEVTGSEDASGLLEREIGPVATVRGPAVLDDRLRWLIHGADLDRARVGLRTVVATLRDRGAKVRIDVDPHDL